MRAFILANEDLDSIAYIVPRMPLTTLSAE